jgi:hypothetical protein
MNLKRLAVFAYFLTLLTFAAPMAALAAEAGATPPATATPPAAGSSVDFPPPHIKIADPAPVAPPAPPAWPVRDRISWAANLVLALAGYAGIMLAVSTLKKIERQTRAGELAAEAAVQSAQVALLTAEAMVRAERPWLAIAIKPSPTVENGFSVIATNHGRSPARIVASVEHSEIVAEESALAETPVYAKGALREQSLPAFLLPGESTQIRSFSREEVKDLCADEEQMKRIERWEEKIYLYGKIVYEDLLSPAGKQTHESAWCCWYIHGRQRSGLVFAGPAPYNNHS